MDQHLIPTTSLCPTSMLPVGTVYEGDIPLTPPTDIQQQSSEAVEASHVTTAGAKEGPRRTKEERKLAIMMMSKKRKRLFEQIMKARRKKNREVSELKRKRREYDETKTGISKKIKVS